MPGWRPPFDVPLVLATFVVHIFTFGPIYAFGVFLPPLKAHFGTAVDATTAVQSVMTSLQFFGSVAAGLLIPRHLRHRTVVAASSVLVLGGYLLAAAVDSLALLYFAMALVGCGLGASNLAGLTALNARIKERRALAVGIATCGTGFGTIALPPIYSYCILALGWRWSLCISGITSAAALGATAPAFWVPAPAAALTGVGPDGGRAGSAAKGASARAVLPPCRDLRYLCWWLNMLFCMSGYFAPPALLAQYAEEEVRTGAGVASAMYTVIGVGALATRSILGCLTAAAGGSRRVHAASQLAVGAVALAAPLCRSSASLLVWSALYGLSMGPLIALISVILSELFGTEMLPLYHGFSRLAAGIGAFLGPPAIGFVADRAGYGVAFGIAGALVIASSVFLVALAVLQDSAAAAASERPEGAPTGGLGGHGGREGLADLPCGAAGGAAAGQKDSEELSSLPATRDGVSLRVCCPMFLYSHTSPHRAAPADRAGSAK
mmetsp:Transcript_144476/g.448573  ORF Transcript_144476/g.448573 Transcript_144476/m.448573 type:complete len:493 (+) Transcript_144476:66-1544(+)